MGGDRAVERGAATITSLRPDFDAVLNFGSYVRDGGLRPSAVIAGFDRNQPRPTSAPLMIIINATVPISVLKSWISPRLVPYGATPTPGDLTPQYGLGTVRIEMAERTDQPHRRVARIRYGCASTDSSSTRRMHACCATERLSLSRRRHSPCCARSCGNRGSLLTTNALLDEVWGHQFVTRLRLANRHQRAADGARRRRPQAALHRDGVAAWLPLHRRHQRDRRCASGRGNRFGDSRSTSALVHRSRGTAVAACAALGISRAAASARIVWVAGEPGIGKTTLIEHFIAGLGDVAVRPRPMRRALRQRRAVSSRARSPVRAVPHRQHARAVAARGRADLAPAAAVAQHRGGARSAAARARRRQPGSHAARDGRASRSLGRAPAAVAGDRGPALERPRDDPAHRLRRATPRQRAPHVARKLSSRRGRGARSSAQPIAARAAPA